MLNNVLIEGRVTDIKEGCIIIKNNRTELEVLIPKERSLTEISKNNWVFVKGFLNEKGFNATSIYLVGDFKLKQIGNLFELTEQEEERYVRDNFSENVVIKVKGENN